MISLLGVLQRPQTPADRNRLPLRRLDHGFPFGSPITSLERLAQVTSSGAKIYLIAITKPTQKRIDQFLAELSPKSALPAMRRQLQARAHRLPTFRGVTAYGIGVSGAGCANATALVTGGCWGSSGGQSGNSVTVIVPDGVSQVAITTRPGTDDSSTLRATVHGNVATFQTSAPVENLGQDKMIWYSRSGAVITRPHPPLSTGRRPNQNTAPTLINPVRPPEAAATSRRPRRRAAGLGPCRALSCTREYAGLVVGCGYRRVVLPMHTMRPANRVAVLVVLCDPLVA